MGQPRALIVDDEADIRELLEITLQRMEISTASAADLGEAKALLGRMKFDLCLTDMRLPDGNGLDLVAHIQQGWPDMPVAVITAHGNIEAAVQALKFGAFDFVSKPVDLQVLRDLVRAAIHLVKTQPMRDRRSRDTLIGDSLPMQRIRATIVKLARNQAPVYIGGESGTGKELVARLIHEKGPRAEQPFIPVNCGAIPADLMESEFFGHKKGTFTGAVADKDGLFQAAHRGTLFLDEVAELPFPMQVKLLRAIQERAVRPIGAQDEIPVDVRILSATHKHLSVLVEDGSFRQDLYYRINVIHLPVPSLRERTGDIPILAKHILEKLAARMDIPVPVLEADALAELEKYHFPGNVREMENILERAMTLCENNRIRAEDLQLPDSAPAIRQAEDGNLPPFGDIPLEDYLEEVEKKVITNALERTRFNKTAAAKMLGITFRALRYRLKKLGME